MRCVACGEVHWSLRLGAQEQSAPDHCRMCGEELTVEPRRRFGRLVPERADAPQPGEAAGFGGGATT